MYFNKSLSVKMVRSLSTIRRDVYNLEAEFLTLRVSLMHATGAAKDKVKLKMDNIKERFEVVRLEVMFKVYLRNFFYVMVLLIHAYQFKD